MYEIGPFRSHKAQENRVVNHRSQGTADVARRLCAIAEALSCAIAADVKALASSVASRVLRAFSDVSRGRPSNSCSPNGPMFPAQALLR
jgi:hypothetical protein